MHGMYPQSSRAPGCIAGIPGPWYPMVPRALQLHPSVDLQVLRSSSSWTSWGLQGLCYTERHLDPDTSARTGLQGLTGSWFSRRGPESFGVPNLGTNYITRLSQSLGPPAAQQEAR